MKTRHIIAIGLLSATAVALLGIAMAKNNKKPKTLQTKADYQIIGAVKSQYDNDYIDTTIITQNYYQLEYEENNKKYITNTTIQTEIKTYLISSNSTRITINVQPKNIELREYTNNALSQEYIILPKNSIEFPKRTVFYDTIQEIAKPYSSTLNTNTFYYFNQNNIESIELDFNLTYSYNTDIQIEHENEWEIEIQPINLNYQELILYNYQYENNTNSFLTTYNTILHTYNNGYETGYNNGYGIGYVDAGIYNEVIDLRGTMLQILTMPFTFITQAFDVTIFPNTPYEFNFSRLIMGILAISAILFIIKLFTSGLSVLGNYTNNKTDRDLKRSQIELNKSKADLNKRTNPNHKSSYNENHNYKH